jgi:hypothetical protein
MIPRAEARATMLAHTHNNALCGAFRCVVCAELSASFLLAVIAKGIVTPACRPLISTFCDG